VFVLLYAGVADACWVRICRDDTRNLGRQGLNQLDGDLHALLSMESPLSVVSGSCDRVAPRYVRARDNVLVPQTKLRESIITCLGVIDHSIAEKKWGMSRRIFVSARFGS
jgi:hypothetical protein